MNFKKYTNTFLFRGLLYSIISTIIIELLNLRGILAWLTIFIIYVLVFEIKKQ